MNRKLKQFLSRTLVICTLALAGGTAMTTMNSVTAYASTYRTTDDINLRGDMNLSMDPVIQIPKGTEFDITWVSEDGAWAEVEYQGHTGYILTMYLTQGEVSESSDSSDSSDSTADSTSNDSTSNDSTANSGSPLIVIDPGHGGEDPGAVSTFNGIEYHESDYTYAIAEYLVAELQNLGYQTVLTHNGVDDVSLKERVEMANSANAALFFSMHHNAADSSVDGALTIYPSVKSNGDETLIDYSKELSYMISEAYVGTGMDVNGIYADQDVSGYPLYVLNNSNMVSVLTEMGFITNPGDVALIADPSFQQELAINLAHQIDNYFQISR